MKKVVLSPLCSALVIPGLGQIINQHIKKGVSILLGVFILFIAAAVKMFYIVSAALKSETINPSDSGVIIDRFRVEDFSLLWCLLLVFAILWLYSVLDAFIAGRKLDQLEKWDS